MAIPVIASVSTATTGGDVAASLEIGLPAGTASNDGLVGIVGGDADNASAYQPTDTPSGYNLIETHSGGADADIAAFERVADGTEPSTLTFTRNASAGSDEMLAWLFRITGIDPANFINAVSTKVAGGGSSLAVTGLTTTVDDCLVISVMAGDGGDLVPYSVSGTGWSLYDELTSGTTGSDVSAAIAVKEMPVAGDSGTCTFNASSSDGKYGFQFAIAAGAGSSGQTITGSDHVDADTFGSGTVSAGSVSITGSVFTDADSFGSGSIAPGAVTISGALHVDPDSFAAGVISAGAVSISGASHDDPDSFGSGQVNQGGGPAQVITGAAFSDADTFGAGSLSLGAVAIVGTAHVDPDAFGAGSLQPGAVTITGTLYADPDTFGGGTVSQGGTPPQFIGGSAFLDDDAFGSGAIQPGPISIGGGQHVDADTFGAGLVAVGAVTITGAQFVDLDQFGAGDMTPGPVVIAGTGFVDPDVFGLGAVLGDNAIRGRIAFPEDSKNLGAIITASNSGKILNPSNSGTLI